jgi:hypothetical protein
VVGVVEVLGADDDPLAGSVQYLGGWSLEGRAAGVDHDQPVTALFEFGQDWEEMRTVSST